MIIEQTVEIPANRRLHLDIDIPCEIPTEKVQIEVKVFPFPKKTENSATSITDSLVGVLSHAGDITLEEIREERLAKYLK